MRTMFRKIYTLPVFMGLGLPLFILARARLFEPLTRFLARVDARIVLMMSGRRTPESPQELAEEWNRLMPTPRSNFPILKSDDRTAYVEIRVRCPFRGTGDAEACWRAMEFDRELVGSIGGQLIVMESQSNSGKDYCSLAIRRSGDDLSDLEAAHPRWLSK